MNRSHSLLGILILVLTFVQPAGKLSSFLADFTCSSVVQIPPSECDALVKLFDDTNGSSWINNTNWLANVFPGGWHGVTVTGGHVTIINLADNQLSGTIPSEIGNLIYLQELILLGNQLGGSIPPQLGNLTSLVTLDLQINNLSGSLPPEMGNLVNLQILWLNSNSLSGPIPAELGNLTNLRMLYLFQNQLTGNIPAELGNLTNLLYLTLHTNQLSGPIPSALGKLVNLKELSLSQNQLNGRLPNELGNLTHLERIWLEGNLLIGRIPPSFTNLKVLAQFEAFSTWLCDPPDQAFQDWKRHIYWETPGPCYSISGKVTYNGSPLADVAISAWLGQYTTTGLDGTYELIDLPYNYYTVRPFLFLTIFDPTEKQVLAYANISNVNFTKVQSLVPDSVFLPMIIY